MYICVCQGITEDQVQQAASSSKNINEALKKLGVGKSCGICLIDAINQYGLQSASGKSKQKRQQETLTLSSSSSS